MSRLPHDAPTLRGTSLLVGCAVLVGLLLAAPLHAQRREITESYPDGAVKFRYTVDKQGRKHGSFEHLRPDGSVFERKEFREGRLHGKFVEFDAQGRRRYQANFRDDQLHGKLEEFGPNGVRTLLEHYKAGELDGRREEFDRLGESLGFVTYKGGELEGKFEQQLDGGLTRSGVYKQGALDGLVKIRRDREVISKQVYAAGALQRLDELTPFHIGHEALREKLAAILAEPETLPKPPVKDPEWPRRMAALRHLQAYRALCGLRYDDMELVPEWNALCDLGAKLCKAIGRLDHTPPKPDGYDDEEYRQGYEATSHSNLSQGGSMISSVAGYMDDSDPTNIDRVGHRRWCLNPSMRKTAFGEAGHFSAMWSFDSSGSGVRGVDAIHYPPKGWTPTDFFGPAHAWSIHMLSGGLPALDDITIEIVELDEHWLPVGEAVPLNYAGIGNAGYGTGETLIFRPERLEVSAGARYRCTITFAGDRKPRFDYIVAFCEAVGNVPR